QRRLPQFVKPVGDGFPDLARIDRLLFAFEDGPGPDIVKVVPRGKVDLAENTPYAEEFPVVLASCLCEFAKPSVPAYDVVRRLGNVSPVARAPSRVSFQHLFDDLVGIPLLFKYQPQRFHYRLRCPTMKSH